MPSIITINFRGGSHTVETDDDETFKITKVSGNMTLYSADGDYWNLDEQGVEQPFEGGWGSDYYDENNENVGVDEEEGEKMWVVDWVKRGDGWVVIEYLQKDGDTKWIYHTPIASGGVYECRYDYENNE